MGIMTSKDLERNSELNRRISADLRERIQTATPGTSDYDEEETYATKTKKNWPFWLGLDCFDYLGDYFANLYRLYLVFGI